MSTKPARPRWLLAAYAVMALLLVAGSGYGFWPLFSANQAMTRFCEKDAPGLALPQLQARAEAAGYALSAPGPGQVLVDDPPALGRRQCLLRLDDQGRVKPP